jgi:hypothetical protein
MIEVYHTLINESEVIGVGPLYSKRNADPTLYTLYKERQWEFEIYTRGGGRVAITTSWLPFTTEQAFASKAEYDTIFNAHRALRQCLINRAFWPLLIEKEHESKTE